MKIFALASLAALGSLAACNYIGDDNGCVVGYDDNKPQKDCRFGPPVPPGEGCGMPIVVDKSNKDCDGLTWSEVWQPMSENCASSGCHDNNNGTFAGNAKVYLSRNKPAEAFNALANYAVKCGLYVNSKEPEKSQILNNLAGVSGAGVPMPYGGGMLPAETMATVTTWAKCGAPQ